MRLTGQTVCVAFLASGLASGGELERMPCNNPGTTVDLGVGLWAWPLPMDFDGDGDGVQDLAIGVGDWKAYGWDNAYDANGAWTNGVLHGYVYVVRNRGSAEKPEYAEPVLVVADGKPVDVFGWPSPNFADWDGDGDLDLICGDEKNRPLQFNGKRAGQSGRRKLCVVDWDGDGLLDILINSKNAEFWRQVGEKDGRVLFENRGDLHQKNIEGHDVSPTSVDFDDDGIPDFIGGAEDGHLCFLRNPRAR